MSPEPPPPGSVPVTAVILAKDECAGIEAAVRSVAWCTQVIVVDSGSTDGTQRIAAAAGAEVWSEPWRGYGPQREYTLRHPAVENDWVLYVDADEWVPAELAREISDRFGRDGFVAYRQRLRLVFLGRWIRHCGWYENSWTVRLLDRRASSWAGEIYGERARVDGPIGVLACDIVSEDRKGLARWLTKHVGYAELEARRRESARRPWAALVALARSGVERGHRPISRTIAKEVVWPFVPAKALTLFLYMFVARGGWRDGRVGFAFCYYHAWHHFTIGLLGRPEAGVGAPAAGPRPPFDDLVPYTAASPAPSPFPAPAPAPAGVPGPRLAPPASRSPVALR